MNMCNSEADLSQKDSYKIKAFKAGNESFVKGNGNKLFLV